MFYFLSKTLFYLLTPAGWVFLALLGTVLIRQPRVKRRFALAALVLFWLFGNSQLVNEGLRIWEVPPAKLMPKAAGAPPRVAVLLTGGMINTLYEPQPLRPVFSHEADRAQQALWLYQTGRVQAIIISGGIGTLPFTTPGAVDEGEMVRLFLQRAGVPQAHILLENQSRNTYENALYSARLLRERFGTTDCVVVTSAWHMRRAVGCFQKQGLRVTSWSAGQLTERPSRAWGAYLLPAEKAFYEMQLLTRELVGYLMYRVTGYL
ncbi:YdcF family protein [Rudanella paleaurantiibacter]|uniref:YdcF family protein n=1 Tax=Rudanella paleaurantiibacter TaxID=2614655 RepID=A0A7J5U345_9BACT|nr:YdcF family protein [Rudanella paleaurantiibacter]KAB7732217.1 YdcF family protein [Rudanella paleaurantiibacter]